MLPGTASRWLKQTITRYAKSSHGNDGLPTFSSTAESIACRIDQKNQKVVTPQGDELVSTTQIIVSGDYTIDPEDKIVLPDSSEPLILAVEENAGPNGTTHHTTIYT